ncbi:MAG TPA: prepilin-type N-terminal cleavage/methylation domain-containing protein [Burkholderiales bacterium]|nr:prepilin-type N-terminal cleavage/methylation domain-containing protein [Burkholderiales bacterium]
MSSSAARRERGLSLIELVVFIVVLAIGVAGVAILFNQMTRSSVDPVVRKQALAIATSLMEEIELHAFTYCDPDDPAVGTAASAAACATPEAVGPEPGETRYADPRFDNVNDYDGFSMAGGIRDVTNTLVPGLGGYSASISVQPVAAGELPGIPAGEGLRITVTVSGPANANVVLQGYRLRYAPNTP